MTSESDHIRHENPPARGWIALDLDGTLARYDSRHGIAIIGKAIAPTLSRVKHWLDSGIDVRIFTARASDPALLPPIQKWLVENNLPPLTITHRRDADLMQLWDDRVVQVGHNTGEVLTPKQHISLDFSGWIGVELDGTLAHYRHDQDPCTIGAPVEKMYSRVLQWLKLGVDVRLFTARAADPALIPVMEKWLNQYHLEKMTMTCEKDFAMWQFWDDRGIHVVSNTGEVAAQLSAMTLERKYPPRQQNG